MSPFTVVPLVEPASWIDDPPPGVHFRKAWKREMLGSGTTVSLRSSRPIVIRSPGAPGAARRGKTSSAMSAVAARWSSSVSSSTSVPESAFGPESPVAESSRKAPPCCVSKACAGRLPASPK